MEIMEEIEKKELVKSFQSIENENANICTVILNVNNPKLGIKKQLSDIQIFGKTMKEWVANAVFDTNIKYVSYEFGEDFLPVVKNAVDTNSKYTFVLFSDTPLFQRKTFLQIMEYFKMKDLSVLKLTRGYVFETQYLLKIESLLNPQIQYFEEEDFVTCFSLKQLSLINDIMKNRILNYFMKNGVIIEDPSTTFIDADVQIGANTVIKPFNELRGNCIVEDGVLLDSNNLIYNSVICEKCRIHGATIKNSLLEKNVEVFEHSKICKNSKICESVKVPAYCLISNAVVTKDDKLKSFYEFIGD